MAGYERKRKKLSTAGQLGVGLLTELIALILLLAVFAALGTKGVVTERAFSTLSALSCFIAATAGAMVYGKLRGRGPLQCGGIVAGVLALIILCGSIGMGEGHAPGFYALTAMATTIAGGVFGGVLGTKKKKRRTRV